MFFQDSKQGSERRFSDSEIEFLMRLVPKTVD
jgi:hypothetical protein